VTTEVFFSVDVETTGAVPRLHDLLSVGATAFTWSSDDGASDEIGCAYFRVAPNLHGLRWDPDTREWWSQQNELARREAYEDEKLPRLARPTVAYLLMDWVTNIVKGVEQVSTVTGHPIFAANPTGFDWQWVNDLLWDAGQENLFSYRPLCIRSMAFGMGPITWDSDRTDWGRFHVEPTIPHHPEWDARAQAQTLIRLLEHRETLQ
jgi:hypothetical protein